MSSQHEHRETPTPWIDRWWPLLIILFGLVFTLCLTLYRPQHEWSSARPAPSVHQIAFRARSV